MSTGRHSAVASRSRKLGRPARSYGQRKRQVHRPGRVSVAQTSRLEQAGPVVFLVIISLTVLGIYLGLIVT